jgi:aminopeptidase N
MDKCSVAALNTLSLSAEKAEFSEQLSEQIFVLSSSQLNQIIKEAIKEATEPLKREIEDLWQGYNRLANDAAYNSQRVKKLEYKEPQPKQRDRSEILRALIAAYGGKMLAKEARKKMGISEQLFSMLLASMTEYIEIKPMHSDKRQNLLILK